MKNVTLLLAGLLIAGASMAQPTLTGATINPLVGERFYNHDNSDTAGISNGPAGAGVTWNLSTLDTTITDSMLYVACASTPFCDSFSGSNLAYFDGSEYIYFTADAAKFAYSGVGEFVDSGGGCVYFPDLQNIIGYITTYGSVKVDTFHSTQPTFGTNSHGIDSFIADAYGTLILPSGTFSNVMRVHMITYEIDSFDLSGGMWDTLSWRSDYYFWYKSGFHNPLAFMEYDSSGGATYLADVAYYTQGPDSVVTDTTHPSGVVNVNNAVQVQLYPNPANDQVHIRLRSQTTGPVSITALDATGRVVIATKKQNVTTGTNDIDYDISSLAPGMYLIKIQAGNNTVLKKIDKVQ